MEMVYFNRTAANSEAMRLMRQGKLVSMARWPRMTNNGPGWTYIVRVEE